MCLIIHQPHGVKLDRAVLKRGFTNNSDGAGFMFAVDGVLQVHKGYFGFRKFWKAYRLMLIKHGSQSDFIIHFRIGTSGAKDKNNCHPHKISPDLAFVHNGIISKITVENDAWSDTIHFNKQVLQHLPTGFYENVGIMELIAEYISTDKLAFMDSKGEVAIVNKALGDEDFDCWFSNSTYKPMSERFFGWQDDSYMEEGDYAGSFGYQRFRNGQYTTDPNYEPNYQSTLTSDGGTFKRAANSSKWTEETTGVTADTYQLCKAKFLAHIEHTLVTALVTTTTSLVTYEECKVCFLQLISEVESSCGLCYNCLEERVWEDVNVGWFLLEDLNLTSRSQLASIMEVAKRASNDRTGRATFGTSSKST